MTIGNLNNDCLHAPDAWLDSRCLILKQQIALLLDQLQETLEAKATKSKLQQCNQVVVRRLSDKAPHVSVEVMSVISATKALQEDRNVDAPTELIKLNEKQQRLVWFSDGYDLDNQN